MQCVTGVYPSIAMKLASLFNIPVARLDYRQPGKNKYCVPDIYAAMDFISHATRYPSVSKFILVGWSFGGAPAFTVASGPRRDQIIGVATIASQTAQADGIDTLSPTPVLLIHGTADQVLSSTCSESLYDRYGNSGKRTLRLFEGDTHGLTKNTGEVEKLLLEFIISCIGIVPDGQQVVDMATNLVGDEKEGIETMKEGHDLENGECLD